MTSLSRSDAFAFLVPISIDAAEALKLSANKKLLANSFDDFLIPHRPFDRGERPYVVKLDYALLFGRLGVTFGSSRCNELQFPKAPDIDAYHFVLHFEMQIGVLLLTDVSSSGTLISTHSTQDFKRLHGATYPLLQTSYIHFGREQRYRFEITLTPYTRDISVFINLFGEYARSVRQPFPAFVKEIRSIKTPLMTFGEKFVGLHSLGQSKFEVVHTCIRFCDGRLFAIKQFCHQTIDSSPQLRRVSENRAYREIELLRDIRHPNIVGFVDHINLPHSTFLVMDFVPIGNLADFLNTPQLENSVRPLVRQCLYALRHLHDRAISHRNIRPESILVRSWRPLNIQLCNFGGAERSWSIARSFFSGPRLHEENFFALDIWALGVLTLAASGCWHQVQAEEGGDHGLLSPGDALPDFRHLPCAALLDGMLKADAWSRHSAEKCLQDPWLQKEVIRKRRGSALEIFDTRPAKRLKNIKDDCTRDCYNDAGCF